MADVPVVPRRRARLRRPRLRRARGALPPGTREAFQTQEQLLSAKAAGDQRIRGLQYQIAAEDQAASGGRGGNYATIAPPPPKLSGGTPQLVNVNGQMVDPRDYTARRALEQASPEGRKASLRAAAGDRADLVWDEEGAGGQGEYIPAAQARIRAAERGVTFDPTTNTLRPKGEVLKESANMVTYQDPYTGATSYKTPHEANLAGAEYREQLKRELAKGEKVPAFGDISADKLLSLVRNGSLADPEQVTVVREALQFHGYEPASIDVLLKDARREAAPPDKTFTASEIARQVEEYGMDIGEAWKRLEAAGYSPEEARTKLRLERDKLKEDPLAALLKEIQAARGVTP